MRRNPLPLPQATGGTCGVLSVLQPAASFLTLPRIGADVPALIGQYEAGERIANLAAVLAELSILRPSHLVGGTALIDNAHIVNGGKPWPLTRVIEFAVKEWVGTLFAGVQGIDTSHVRCMLTHDVGDCDLTIPHTNKADDNMGVGMAGFVFRTLNDDGSTIAQWLIGDELTYLEGKYRGLGRYLLAAITSAYSMTCQAWDAADAFNVVEWSHWNGMDSEKGRLAEETAYAKSCGNPAFDTEYFCQEAGIITKKQWKSLFPSWAWNRAANAHPSVRLSRSTPDNVVRLYEDARALRTLVDRAAARWESRRRSGQCNLNDIYQASEGTASSAPIILRWSQTDPIAHLFDEQFNYHFSNGDETNLFDHAVIAFDPNKRASIREACERLEDYAAIVRAAGDVLIQFATKHD